MASEMLYTSTDLIMHLVIVPCLMAIGFFTNASFLYTIWRSPELQTIPNAYLASLAIADLIFIEWDGILFFVLPYVKSSVKRDFGMSPFGCQIVTTINVMCFYTSVILISTVAVERYIAVCHPLHQRTVSSKSRTTKLITFAWILGAILSLVLFLTASGSTFCIIWPAGDEFSKLPNKIVTCSPVSDSSRFSFFPILDFMIYATCFFLNLTMYAKIIVTLRRRASKMSQHQAQQEHNHVARLLTINGLVFFICFAPYQCANMDYMATVIFGSGIYSYTQLEQIYRMSVAFSFVNSSINLFVYIGSSAKYRSAYLKALGLYKGDSLDNRTSTLSDNRT